MTCWSWCSRSWSRMTSAILCRPGPPLTQQIFGSISSVNRAEWYSAGQEGRKPELVFTTPIINYSGQPEAEYHGTRYSIYRTYLRQGSDEMELYLERKAGVQSEHQS